MPTIHPSAIFSTLFRLLSWVFLRMIYVPQAHVALVTIFGLFVIFWLSENKPEDDPRPIKVVDLKDRDEKAPNGNGVYPPVEGIVIKPLGPSTVLPTKLLFSLPSRERWINWFHFLTNTLLALLVLDSTISPRSLSTSYDDVTFARVGAVYSDAVKIHIRYPGLIEDTSLHSGVGVLKVVWREVSAASVESEAGLWKDGPVVQLSEENDWVGVAHLSKLWPAHNYQFRLAYPNSTFLPYPSTPLPFRTFPDPRQKYGTQFTFIASDGIRPNFPYKPSLSPLSRYPGFDLLKEHFFPELEAPVTTVKPTVVDSQDPVPEAEAQPPTSATPQVSVDDLVDCPPSPEPLAEPAETQNTEIPQPTPLVTKVWSILEPFVTKPKPAKTTLYSKPPAFLLLLGDLLPQKAPLPFKTEQIDFSKEFRSLFASPSFRAVYERLPVIHAFGSRVVSVTQADPISIPERAASAYDVFSQSASYPPTSRDGKYFEFKYGDNAFFVLDTTTHRSPVDRSDEPEAPEPTLLGSAQVAELFAWAAKVNHTTTFKFVVSPVPFSQLWGPSLSQAQTWADYPSERARVLELLSSVMNLIIVSGGPHEFAHINYFDGKVPEFITGPLSADTALPIPGLGPLQSRATIKVTNETKVVTLPPVGYESAEEADTIVLEDIKEVAEEQLVKHVRAGNHKWSTFEVDTTVPQVPTLAVTLFVDGEEQYQTLITGQQVPFRKTSAVGAVLTGGLKGVLGKMGFGRLFGKN
ncbi:hypothetical protein FS837_001248 [Tulasnella sp. UAMH 9824]|nr:hypothetical protein FS837_001248 [Tulasnella sp. UAMH 9824]